MHADEKAQLLRRQHCGLKEQAMFYEGEEKRLHGRYS